MHLRRLMVMTAAASLVCLLAVSLPGQTGDAKTPAAATPAPAVEQPKDNEPSLAAQQEAIRLRYERFENMLVQMAQYMRKTDPDRADLLFRAIKQSKGGQVSQVMKQIIVLLEKNSLGDAVERQADLVVQLRALLKLLQSEGRMEEIDADIKWYKDVLGDVRRLLGKERDVRAGTERGDDPDRLAGKQGKVAEGAENLVKKIDARDAAKNADGEGKPGEGKPGEGKPGEGKPGEGKPGEGKPGEGKPGEGKPGEGKPGEGKPGEGKPGEGKPGEGKPGEGKPGEGKPGEGKPGEGKPGEGKPGEGKPGEGKPGEGKPGEGKPGEGKPGEGKPGEGKPGEGKPGESGSDDKKGTPGRDEIEQARQEMEKAIQELKKKKLDDAAGNEDEAIAKLEQAKEKLEEILRQLREEERELLLAALEARFQKMLAIQIVIYNGTISLSKTPNDQWTDRHHGRSRDLAVQEGDLVLEASKALTLLREEGSSVAFPEAVEQIREDMQTVAGRLGREEVGELTQLIEKDIIEMLGEVIEALQKEMEKSEDEPPPSDQPPQEPQDPPLVDKLAELKMLRSLQMRINRRTKRLGRMIDGEQAQKPDVVNQLQDLSKRQGRVQDATYDLVTGKNR